MAHSLPISILIFLFSVFITYLIIIIANRYNIIDMPNARSSHVVPTPRGGGLAIVLSWYIGITYLWVTNYILSELYFALISGVLLAIISLIDDLISISPKFRLVIQILTAVTALFFLEGFEFISNENFNLTYKLLINLVVVIGMVWFINLYNFLDGIDGYASIEAIFIALAIFLFTGNFILLVLVASTSGFLVWNWPKAKIFMGDIGSTQLGFVFIVLGIYFHNNSQFSFWFWVLLTSPFWFDASYTLFLRWRNKEVLSQAHKKHIYQRIVQSGFSHLKTDLYLVIINIVIFVIVLALYKFKLHVIIGFIVILMLLFIISKLVNKRKPFNS